MELGCRSIRQTDTQPGRGEKLIKSASGEIIWATPLTEGTVGRLGILGAAVALRDRSEGERHLNGISEKAES